MITIYNIRGTNGSGKTTLARSFMVPGRGYSFHLTDFPSPTKALPDRRGNVPGTGYQHDDLDVLLVGSYQNACGGLDAVPDFETSFSALRSAVNKMEAHSKAPHRAILAEGILASTVWGSWGKFSRDIKERRGVEFAFCYLDTPLEVCLARIKERQERAGKVRDIKEDLVADKIKAIAATRRKALEAGALVYDLPYETAEEALRSIMVDDKWTAAGGVPMSARERYRARA